MTFLASIRDGLADHARIHALLYVLAILLAINASVSALVETFGPLGREQMDSLAWWQVGALVGKCLQPGVAALIALLVKSPLQPSSNAPKP